MVADIHPPDYETRLAILQKIVDEKEVEIPNEYLEMIARSKESNIRELEGALTKVISFFKLGLNPSREDIAKMLQIDIDSKRKKTCLDKYGDEHVVNSKYTREKTKEKLGVEYSWQSIHVRKNFIEAMVEKYGVDNPMKIEEVRDRMIATKIAKYGGLDTFNHYKDYVFPSGRIDKVQGYEPMALDILLQSHSEEDIVTGKSITAMTGPFKYFSDITGRWHYYYPDIFIVSENRIIEVKSKWTYEKQIETNQLKKLAVEERGFTFEFIIF